LASARPSSMIAVRAWPRASSTALIRTGIGRVLRPGAYRRITGRLSASPSD
jgi:hypothetical protein